MAGQPFPGRQQEYRAVVDLGAQLTVLGSLNMDISVTVPALPGPGATVLGGAAAFAPGGKGANQAVAAARLGAPSGIGVRMVGCVGGDDFGRALRAALVAEGVDDTALRTVPGVPTGIAMITVDQTGENMITVAPGANREVGAGEVAAAGGSAVVTGEDAGEAGEAGEAGVTGEGAGVAGRGAVHVLVISAEVPVPAIAATLDACAAREPRPLTVLNLAPAPPEAADLVAKRPDWLVVNEPEAAAVLGRPVSGLAAAASAAADLVAAGAANAVVTAGRGRRGLPRRKRRTRTNGGGLPSQDRRHRGSGRHVRGRARGGARRRDRASGSGHRRRGGRRDRGDPARHPGRNAPPRRRAGRNRLRLATLCGQVDNKLIQLPGKVNRR